MRRPAPLARLSRAALVAALLASGRPGGAAVLSCPVTITGAVEVRAVVWYEHEAEPHGGHLYTFTTPPVMGAGTADLDQVEGFPVAVEWWAGDVMLKRCGTRPDRISWDGFEGGNTARWRTP